MAVTEAEVEAAIAAGAHTRQAVTRACRAGGDCGACHGMIESMIEDHLEAAGSAAARSGGVAVESGCPPRVAAAGSGPELVPATALVRGRAA